MSLAEGMPEWKRPQCEAGTQNAACHRQSEEGIHVLQSFDRRAGQRNSRERNRCAWRRNGKAADATLLQVKMLNVSKGPAVRSARESDKMAYPAYMYKVLRETANLDLREAYVDKLLVENGKAAGIVLEGGEKIHSEAVILSGGTYLASRVLVGLKYKEIGPDNQRTSTGISTCLKELGFRILRLKTGSPPRIRTDSIDFRNLTPQYGDLVPQNSVKKRKRFFPLKNRQSAILPTQPRKLKKLSSTISINQACTRGLWKGLDPGIALRLRTRSSASAIRNGIRSSLNPKVWNLTKPTSKAFQQAPRRHSGRVGQIRSGLENAVITKYAYAIEYDAIDPLQLKPNLESKPVRNLFSQVRSMARAVTRSRLSGLDDGDKCKFAHPGKGPLRSAPG